MTRGSLLVSRSPLLRQFSALRRTSPAGFFSRRRNSFHLRWWVNSFFYLGYDHLTPDLHFWLERKAPLFGSTPVYGRSRASLFFFPPRLNPPAFLEGTFLNPMMPPLSYGFRQVKTPLSLVGSRRLHFPFFEEMSFPPICRTFTPGQQLLIGVAPRAGPPLLSLFLFLKSAVPRANGFSLMLIE